MASGSDTGACCSQYLIYLQRGSTLIVENLYLKDAPYASEEHLNNTNNVPYGVYTANGLGPWPSVQTEPNTTVRLVSHLCSECCHGGLSTCRLTGVLTDHRSPDMICAVAAPVDERDIDVLLDGGLFELLKCGPWDTCAVTMKNYASPTAGHEGRRIGLLHLPEPPRHFYLWAAKSVHVIITYGDQDETCHADFQAKVVFALQQLFNTSVVDAQPDLVTLRGNLTLPLPVTYASNGSGALRRRLSPTAVTPSA